MIRFQPDRTRGIARQNRGVLVLVLLCLALLALVAVLQVVHTHAASSDADHCPLCISLHTVAPASMAAAIIVLVQIAAPAPVFPVRRAVSAWHATLFTRPPPQPR